jgi:hypothetical protein
MADHPDADLLRQVEAALNHWKASAYGRGPTSQISGGGAVAAVERWASDTHGGRPALLLPSATYGLRIALQVLGVRAGDEVLVPAVDWPASRAAVVSLGARPKPVAVDEDTLTIGVDAASAARSSATRAVIACHLHGVPADVPGLRSRLPGLPVVEDCAQALGATLDGLPVGTLADVSVFSLGPGKAIDAGEAGVLLVADDEAHRRAARLACHPVRQLLAGIVDPDPNSFTLRPHPVAAILAMHAVSTWNPSAARQAAEQTSRALTSHTGLRVLTGGARREPAGPFVPVLVSDNAVVPHHLRLSPTGAVVAPEVCDSRLQNRVRRTYLARFSPETSVPT